MDLYDCNFCPTEHCKYCNHKKWCILSDERKIVEENISKLEKELKEYENMLIRVNEKGISWYEFIDGEKVQIAPKEIERRIQGLKKDLKTQHKYVERCNS